MFICYCGLDILKDLWWFCNAFPSYCLLMAFDHFMAVPLDLNLGKCLIFALIGTGIQGAVFYNVIYWNIYTPFQLVGAKVKFMIEFIPALIASVWHQFLVFKFGEDDVSLLLLVDSELGPIFLLAACTMYFHLIARFMHRAYDITEIDVCVGLAMQIFCYMVCGELFVRVMGLSFCFGLSIYRKFSSRAIPNIAILLAISWNSCTCSVIDVSSTILNSI